MRKISSLVSSFLLLAATPTMAAEIWSDAIYTQQTSTQSQTQATSTSKVWYKTYDEVKATGCWDAKFSLGEGWYCKDQVVSTPTPAPTPSPEPTPTPTPAPAPVTPTTENWTEPSGTPIWTEAEYTEQTQDEFESLDVSSTIENGVIYAPVEDITLSLGLIVLPLDEQKGIAVIKGDKEVLYFFQGQKKYVKYTIATEKMEAFALPKAIEQKNSSTIVPIDILVQFAGGSMKYDASQKKVIVNGSYSFPVTAKTEAAYTQQWTESLYTDQWMDTSKTQQWTEAQYTEQWADTPTATDQWMDTSNTGQWMDTSKTEQWAETPPMRIYKIFETDPINEKGRLLVPLRELFEMLGAKVNWDDKTKTVTSERGTISVKLTIGSTAAYVNGQKKTLDVAGKLVNGRTMVPLRFISEAFGEKVNYDAKLQEVTVGNYTIFLPPPKSQAKPATTPPKTTSTNNNKPYGGMTDQQWETQKILDRYWNNSFNMTGSYRPSYQWNSGY